MLLPALFYCIWDGIFTDMGIWFFNEKYITGIFIFNLPIEEVLFFFVVPYCCIFVYECVRTYFPVLKTTKLSVTILWSIGFVLFMSGVIFSKKYYTSYTSYFSSIFFFFVLAFRKYFSSFNIAAFLVAYAIILIPFLVVNGFLTAIPVITYNDTENLSTRIYTIPVEDIFYGMLLVMMNVVGYEKLLKRENKA